jgi:uncharacterized protein YcbX
MSLHVTSLRRYPVKSMGGENIESAPIDQRGLVGDRAFAVRDGDSRLASGKNTRRMVRRDGVFDFAARIEGSPGADGSRLDDGPHVIVARGDQEWRVGDPALDAVLSDALRADVSVAPESDVPHFDDGAISLVGTATLEWCARELGADADPRRLRVNIVVQTQEPFEEEAWRGDIRIGDVTLRPAGRVERCRTIDLPQDGVEQRTRWLKPLGDARDARVAIYCDVVTPGSVQVGDEVIPTAADGALAANIP